METMTIRWERAPDVQHVRYFIGDVSVGENDAGFDKILDTVRARKNVRVVLKIQHNPSLGGNALRDTLPFKARFDELEKAVSGNKLVYEFG